MKGACILVSKERTSQKFLEDGTRKAITYCIHTPCRILGVKIKERDSYNAVLLSFGEADKKNKKVCKREIRFPDDYEIEEIESNKLYKVGKVEYKIGQVIDPASFFESGEKLIVSGTSKSKGFQGVVKRHGFAGGPKTHGQSDRERAPGSIGSSTTPGRVLKGKKMAGRMGGKKVTIKNVLVSNITKSHFIIEGILPGPKGAILSVVSI